MKVKNYSFRIDDGPIALSDFFAFIESDDRESYAYNGLKRLLYVKVHGPFVTGMIVSPKDHKTYLAIQKQGERLTIKAHEIEDGSQLCDFNIFIINPASGNGIYTHYHGGMSLDTLDGYLNLFYKRCKRKTLQRERKLELVKQNLEEDEIEAILDEECRGDIRIFPVYRAEEIADIVKSLSEVRAVSISTKTSFGSPGQSSPFDDADLDYTLHRWKIKAGVVGHPSIKDKLLAFLGKNQIEDGSVRGRMAGQEIKDIPFRLDPVTYDEQDFDDILKDFEIEPKDYESTEVFKVASEVAKRLGVI